jgi:hypothetical protein
MKRLVLVVALFFCANACIAAVPPDLAGVVLKSQLSKLEGGDAFVFCISIDGKDPDEKTLKLIREMPRDVVAGSECTWLLDVSKGSYQNSTGRKAMLVDVFNYRATGEVEFEARHHGKWTVMKTLKVRKEPSGWKVVGTLKHLEARAEQMLPSDALKTTRA